MAKNQKYTPALGFDWLTDLYDFIIGLTMPEYKIRYTLLKLISPSPSEKILEFGFGTGQNILFIHHHNKEIKIKGLDIDPKVKKIAQNKLSKKGIDCNLDLYEGRNFPYENNSFNKVYSSLVFHHLSHQNKLNALAEIYRVLKPGGKLIIGDWGKAPNSFMRLAFLLVQIVDGFTTTSANVKGELPSYIKSAGFEDISISSSYNTALGTFSFFTALKQ